MQTTARLTSLRIRNVRSFDSLDLDLGSLTVLIGENGTGKSSIAECVEILRRTRGTEFFTEWLTLFGGIDGLARDRAKPLTLGCRLEVAPAESSVKEWLDYEICIGPGGIASERAHMSPRPGHARPLILFERTGVALRVYTRIGDESGLQVIGISPDRTALSTVGYPPGHPSVRALQDSLAGLQVHVPPEGAPWWAAAGSARSAGVRGLSPIAPASQLARFAENLPNVYHALRNETANEAAWAALMDWVRLGLGEDIESVSAPAAGPQGLLDLRVKRRGRDSAVPARWLSAGELHYLAIVALTHLPSAAPLVVYDEPEVHMHPQLQLRVAGLFARLSERVPVLIATHSRRLLDGLPSPERSVRVLQRGDAGTTSALRLDARALAAWCSSYEVSGLGEALDRGLERMVVSDAPHSGIQ